MAEQKTFDQDLTIINLPRFSKYTSPPQDGNFSKMSVSIFSNGKIRFNNSMPDKTFFGCSVYPFELAVVKEMALPKLKEALKTGTIEDFKTIINVKAVDYQTKVSSIVAMIVGSKGNIPYIAFKSDSASVVYKFTPINDVTMDINGSPMTKEHVAIVYAYSYFTDLISSVSEGFRSLVSMGKNVQTLAGSGPSKESSKIADTFEDDVTF